MQNTGGSDSGFGIPTGGTPASNHILPAENPRERKIILLLCILGAIHIFIFSAAFPFFNNVDEPAHLDLVLQYSHGHLPQGETNTSKETSVYLALFCSCAFLGPSTGQIPPPPWTQTIEKMRQDLAINSAGWQTQKNYEVSEPPLYYVLTGFWWNVGKWLGITGGRLLYWLRFFNIIPVIALVLLAWLTAKIIFPEKTLIRLAVPTLLAFMPQTAFYSITNDVLSPLCFGATFLCLIKWFSRPLPLIGAATGLAFAATWLTKATNLPLLAVVAAAVLVKGIHEIRAGKSSVAWPAFAAFLGCAAPPIIGWMLWSKFNYGDFTGSQLKMDHLGWTVKPFGQWWHHPIFSPLGIWTYVSGELSTFWQGEFRWYYPPAARPLALPGTDIIYTLLSLAMLGAALPGMFTRFSRNTFLQNQALRLSLLCFITALGSFAVASIAYDFHNCTAPSREHPYFQAGRMMLGMLVPFLLLIVCGLDRLLARFKNTTKFTVLAVLVSTMLAVEIITDWPVFSNPYNWFHLP